MKKKFRSNQQQQQQQQQQKKNFMKHFISISSADY
jgi:hypothetical protein